MGCDVRVNPANILIAMAAVDSVCFLTQVTRFSGSREGVLIRAGPRSDG